MAETIDDIDIRDILKQRKITHGNFSEGALLSQNMQMLIEVAPNFKNLSPVQREALQHICGKIGRLLCGQHNNLDSIVDICGYFFLYAKNPKR